MHDYDHRQRPTAAVLSAEPDWRTAGLHPRGGIDCCLSGCRRTGRLDGWGVETVERFLRNRLPVPAEDLLCVAAGGDVSGGAHSVTVRLGQALADAGLSGRPGVSARSIRLTTARRVLDTDGIEAAARLLGSPSLDSTAAALNYDWKQRGV